MCLDIVDNVIEKPEEEGEGWKIIIQSPNTVGRGFSTPFISDCEMYEYNHWVSAKSVEIKDAYPHYKSGFHIFENEKDAHLALKESATSKYFYLGCAGGYFYKVVKAKYRGVLARGKTRIKIDDPQAVDGHLPTVVASQMFVEKRIFHAVLGE